jgi:hypothetical protein
MGDLYADSMNGTALVEINPSSLSVVASNYNLSAYPLSFIAGANGVLYSVAYTGSASYLVEINPGTLQVTKAVSTPHSAPYGITASPNGGLLAVTYGNNYTSVYYSNLTLLNDIYTPSPSGATFTGWTSDSKYLISLGADFGAANGTAYVLNPATGAYVNNVSVFPGASDIAMDPSGYAFWTQGYPGDVGAAGTITEYSVTTGAVLKNISASGSYGFVATTPDDTIIVPGYSNDYYWFNGNNSGHVTSVFDFPGGVPLFVGSYEMPASVVAQASEPLSQVQFNYMYISTKQPGINVAVYNYGSTTPYTSGTTGADGAVSFDMYPDRLYTIQYYNTSLGLNESMSLYPKDPSYTIILNGSDMTNPPYSTNIYNPTTMPSGNATVYPGTGNQYVDISTGYVPVQDGSNGTITMWWNDTTFSTLNVTFSVLAQNQSNGSQQITLNSSTITNNNNCSMVFNLSGVNCSDDQLLIQAYTGRYGLVNRSYTQSWGGQLVTLPDVPGWAYPYISLFIWGLAVIGGAVVGGADCIGLGIAISAFFPGFILWRFGWYAVYIGSTDITLAICGIVLFTGIAVYMQETRGQRP